MEKTNLEGNAHITFKDVEPFIESDPVLDFEDEALIQCIRENKKKLIDRRIARVNALYSEFEAIWPSGSPLHYYIALDMCKDVEITVLDQLQDPNFIQTVVSQYKAKMEGQEKPIIEETVQPVESESSDDYSDESFSTYSQQKSKSHHFNPAEIKQFTSIISNLTKFTTWKEIAKAMHGKTQKECKSLYLRLNESGTIESQFVNTNFSKKIIEKSAADDLEQFSHIKLLLFVCGNQRSVVGPLSIKYKEYAMSNPLSRYMDILTQEPMVIPALSPDGYVFDISTWTKLLKEKEGTNPYTRNKITRRQLVILTEENIEQYRSKIVNLEKIAPSDQKK